MWPFTWFSSLAALVQRVFLQQGVMMAKIEEVNLALEDIKNTIAAEKQEVSEKILVLVTQSNEQVAQIKALQEQIASGGVATAADLDVLVSKAAEIKAGIMGISEV